jgi:sec-independent protein translocase protein TatA
VLNVGPAELLVILLVALIVLGPKKLPDAARSLGKAVAEFRKVTAGLQEEVRNVIDDHVEPTWPTSPPEPPPVADHGLNAEAEHHTPPQLPPPD